jgi:hypothetical protein
MITIKDIILKTEFGDVACEIKIHYGSDHMQELHHVFNKLQSLECKSNTNNMVIFIRALKENADGEDIIIQDYDNNDTTLMFDVCGEDNKYDGLYSIASSDYEELLGYHVDQSTIEKFTYTQIIAHILWEIEWKI